jgi:hypothetical protein
MSNVMCSQCSKVQLVQHSEGARSSNSIDPTQIDIVRDAVQDPPDPLLAILGARSRVSSTVALTLRSRVWLRSSTGDCMRGPLTALPALFTSTSTC